MDDANLNRAVDVLEHQAEIGLPMLALHAAMHRTGAANLTLAALDRSLRDRPDLFAVIDPPALPWATDVWPPDAVARYRTALHDIGFAGETFVVVRPDAGHMQGLIAHLRTTVIALREDRTERTAEAARALLAANYVSASLRRVSRRHDETTLPTILLPDRRPSARGARRAPPGGRRPLPSA